MCLQRTLLEGEVAALMAAEHKPNFILRILTELIWQADLLEGQSVRLDETMSFFEEQIGTCERSVRCAGSPALRVAATRIVAIAVACNDRSARLAVVKAQQRSSARVQPFSWVSACLQAVEDPHPAELHKVRGLAFIGMVKTCCSAFLDTFITSQREM